MKYLYFSAPWCGPCKMFGPVMDKVAQEVPVQKVNVDTDTMITTEYAIRNVPTVVLVNSAGKELARKVGVQQKESLIELYKSFS